MSLVGKKAPLFTLPDQDGTMHSLSDYEGNRVLLYFYPKDNTPGCTTETCSFRDRLNELKAHGVTVLGISRDSVSSHKKFAEKLHLNFPILADAEKTVCDAYGVLVKKSMFGKTYMGVQRDSFLISPTGLVEKHYIKVKPATHVDNVLNDLETITQKKKN